MQGEPRSRRLQYAVATIERMDVRDSARAGSRATAERVVAGGGRELELPLEVAGLDVVVLAEAATREEPVGGRFDRLE